MDVFIDGMWAYANSIYVVGLRRSRDRSPPIRAYSVASWLAYSVAVVEKISTDLACARGPSAAAELLDLQREQTDRQTDRQVQQSALSTPGQVYTANTRNSASKPVK